MSRLGQLIQTETVAYDFVRMVRWKLDSEY